MQNVFMPRNKAYSEDMVLEKAMHVFWGKGYEATSLRLLEKEMGINQFSIYSSFTNKKNLFLESIRKYREYVSQNVYQSLLKEDAGLAELKAFLMEKRKNINLRGCLVVNTAAEVGARDQSIAKEVNLYYDFIRDMLKNVLLNAKKKGEISPDVDVEAYANFFLGVMQGLSIAAKTLDESQIKDFISIALMKVK